MHFLHNKIKQICVFVDTYLLFLFLLFDSLKADNTKEGGYQRNGDYYNGDNEAFHLNSSP
jgi:hypothetical protein